MGKMKKKKKKIVYASLKDGVIRYKGKRYLVKTDRDYVIIKGQRIKLKIKEKK